MALDAPRATAVAHAYLKSGADRRPYMETVSLCASRFQDDPHNQKITVSTFEEYGLNTTHLKDRMLLRPRACSPVGSRCRASASATPASRRRWIYS